MNWSATVLTTVSSDTEPSIIVTFESGKYIFNAGEGTNRAFVQGKQNWKKTKGLFFTDVGTKRAGGLAGLLMSFADATISNLSLVGPPGLSHFLASMRLYTFRDSLHVKPIESAWTPPSESPPEPLYKDINLTVYGVPILPMILPSNSVSQDPSSISEQLETGSKRKRSPSPEHPDKRPALDTEPENPLDLSDEIPETSSDPPSTTDAQEWRKLMISKMFTGTHVEVEVEERPKGRDCKKRKKKSGPKPISFGLKPSEPAADTDAVVIPESLAKPVPFRRNRATLPTGFFNQLPKFSHHITPSLAQPSAVRPTLAYVLVGPRVRGKFDAEKAEELGVFGRLRGKLIKGETVTVKVKVGDESVTKTVRPEDLVGESEAPAVALVLDIPTVEHIPSLIYSFQDHPFYARFRSQKLQDAKEYSVRTIFHLCGKGVLEDARYIAFMNGFVPTVHHIISSREHSPDPVSFTSAAFNQLRLNQLDSEMFPIPKFSSTPKKSLEAIPSLPATTRLMVCNQLIKIRPPAPPKEETSEEMGDRFHPVASSNNPPPLEQWTLQLFSEAKKHVEDYMESGKMRIPKGADVKIVPLGTASAVPTKYRNVSSTLIQIPNHGNVLLDAGEGTWGQLARQFGLDDAPGNVWDVLRDIKCIFASHVHGDHHMGLAHILAKRRKLDPPPSQPLYLVSIRSIHLYLREVSDIQDIGFDDPSGNGVISVMSEALHWRKPTAYQTAGMWQVGGKEPWLEITESQRNAVDMCRSLGLESFETVDMMHRTRCFGAVLKHTDGWSLVFSADTAPANSLVYAGKNATVLIHEATMDNDQTEMAAQKAHSTFGQALNAGRRMNAEHILLTHFSARYPKMPPSGLAAPDQIEVEEDIETKAKEPIVALAFDNANLTIGNMWKVNYYLKAIEQCMCDTAKEENDEEDDEMMDVEVEVALEEVALE